jgi:hypothetical protein
MWHVSGILALESERIRPRRAPPRPSRRLHDEPRAALARRKSLAAVLACGPGAALRRLSAAQSYGFVDGIHGLPWTVADDDGRDAALTAAGHTVLRFSARDVYEHRGAVSARTAAALASSPGLRHAA